MNLSITPAAPSFPMETKAVDCSSFVSSTYLPSVKSTLIWLICLSFIADLYQFTMSFKNKTELKDDLGVYANLLFKGALLSVVLAFPSS